MKKLILLSTLFFTTPSLLFAQEEKKPFLDRLTSIYVEDNTQDRNIYDFQVQNNERLKKALETDLEKKKNLENEIIKLEISEKKYDENLASIKIFANQEIDNLPFLQKVSSRKKSFYTCVLNGVEYKKFPNISNCEKEHPAKFSTKEKMAINNFKMFLSIPKDKISASIKSNQHNLSIIENNLAANEKQYKSSLDWKNEVEARLKAHEKKQKEILALKGKENFYLCSPNMVEIDLENEKIYAGSERKGPFYNVKRDNQDGIGSCYANTAKNLLVSLSDGKMVGSFLDMALQYKKKGDDYVSTGIDGGGSCATLSEVKKNGFCDQKYSPAETGEVNEFLDSLLTKNPSVYSQGMVIEKLRDFLTAKKDLEAVDTKLKDAFLKDPKVLIEKMKKDSDITFPLPIVDATPARNWQTKQAFYAANKNPTVKELDEYNKDVEILDQKFRSKYIQMILDNESYDNIIQAYSVPFKELLEKYGMSASFDQIIKFYKQDFNYSYTEENKKKLFKTVRFLQTITNSDSIPTQSFVASCIDAFEKGFDFLDKLNPLVRQVAAINGNADVLLDGEGIKNGAELMQLAIAPSCLNENNRTKIDFEFSCESGMKTMSALHKNFSGSELNDAFRVLVAKSLKEGLAVGSAFPTYGGRHINTIVGMRYNSETKGCEYKVRESQNGRSEWHAEEPIVKKTDQLTEVSRL